MKLSSKKKKQNQIYVPRVTASAAYSHTNGRIRQQGPRHFPIGVVGFYEYGILKNGPIPV